jgi:NDP-sugar pyrophosphorylase family protein
MMNGDVITTLDFGELLDTHVSSGNALTIATQVRTATIDFGVLRLGERTGRVQQVVGYLEKPHSDYVVSMGVYVVSPHLLQLIEPDAYLDFPDLVLQALGASERVGSYNYDGLWLDIGRHEDYERAISANPDIPSLLRQASLANGAGPIAAPAPAPAGD